jgi:hypothetical protein
MDEDGEVYYREDYAIEKIDAEMAELDRKDRDDGPPNR